MQQTSAVNFYGRVIKRILDFMISLLGTVFISPILIILCLLIRIKLGSPVFFTQVRIGKDEKPFKMIKFRTMLDTRDENGQLLPDDERFSDFGNFLRNTSLDELPELFNVIKGDMSLVGPRPLFPLYLPYYTESESLRHKVRGGITGLAQINGRTSCRWNDRFAYDVKYVKELSLKNDISIIWNTVLKVLRQEDIGVPSMEEEEGLHIVRKVQRPEMITYVDEINKSMSDKNHPLWK